MPRWFVYIVRCRNGSLYTGITTDVPARLKSHNAGIGAKYTRSFGPVSLAYQEAKRSATAARKREAEIKRWSKTKKEALIRIDAT
jgi:putative endonuclease